ncbi:TolC family protein [Chryseobacterium manosquense]|uniref:TolC family protein n=1 Tax=Chryseobacterium manosquense TaxID=2754694 RepID=A0A7H1DXH5_9FLAO|nr:TolC family protein [Chryseobacterium manosquense]QNS41683.1 TolC family protein [Chryseobacterium manosquense]
MEFTQEQKLYAEIVQKAWEDENFKKELVANPIEAIEKLTGKKLNLCQGNGKPFQANSFFKDEGKYLGGGAKITFSLPINNNYAKGNLAKSKIAISDQQVFNENLKRNIELNISIALNNLENTISALEQSKLSLDSYREAFENEQLKFKTGLTTLLNVILFQERLTSAELEYLKSQQSFASAIINLRHETGTLVEGDENGYLVRKENYYTIPK